MTRERELSITVQSSGRVDAVASKEGGIQRSVFSLPSLELFINGQKAKKSQKVRPGDTIELFWEESFFEGLVPQDLPLDVLYEDDDILVINKAQGMAVHPGAGLEDGTVANALLFRYGESFNFFEDDTRPGIVHRLDKDTSGVLIIARTLESHQKLSSQFKEHSNIKLYHAIVKGTFLKRRGEVNAPLERDRNDRKRYTVCAPGRGKDALTEYEVVKEGEGCSLLLIRLHTGRTHQIRVHMSYIGHPVIGDPVYSRRDSAHPDATMMLHASSLTIDHPRTGERLTFEAPLPERFFLR